MVNLYVTSAQPGAGKTIICAGLGKSLQKSGKKVGFLKLTDGGKDGDAAFLKRILGLPETTDDISPVVEGRNIEKAKQALAKVSPGKDVIIIEGLPVDASAEIAQALSAKVIVVENYGAERALPVYKKFGAQMLGVVLNKVPVKKAAAAQSEASAALSKDGISLLGVIPEDRTLMSPTMGELVEVVKGKFIQGGEKPGELIENIMLGAMTIDHGTLYYGRKSNKAVLARSDRPDMQLAALETPTKCIVLVGSTPPIPAVIKRATAKKVALIQAAGDIKSLVADIEKAFSVARFNQDKKLARLGEIMDKGFNVKAIAG